ncbi:MAG: hypothetical protein KTR16_12335 [Acidiferrobacterales bacterium]|nr:hypothetical protein [Acidiferrobacterales bacterium]
MREDEALKKAAGLTFPQLDKKLKGYARKGRFYYSKFTLESPIDIQAFDVKKLAPQEATYLLGDYFLQAGFDSERAEAFFEESIVHDPKHARAIAGLANIKMSTDIESAASLIRSAKAFAPDDPFVATISGHIQSSKLRAAEDEAQKRRLWNKAVREYNKAITADERNLEAIWAADEMYADKERWDKATSLFTHVFSLAPSNYTARTSMIRASFATNKPDQAEYIANIIRNNNHFSEEGLKKFENWYQKTKTAYLDFSEQGEVKGGR